MRFAKPNKYSHVTWITQLLIALSLMLLVSCGREPEPPNPESKAHIIPTTSSKSILYRSFIFRVISTPKFSLYFKWVVVPIFRDDHCFLSF